MAGGDGAAAVTSSVAERARFDAVMRAVLAVSSGLDLTATLQQIVDAAADLADARYAALAAPGRAELDRFVYTGIDETTAALIGPPPSGRGVLAAQRPRRHAEMQTCRQWQPANISDMVQNSWVRVRCRTISIERPTTRNAKPELRQRISAKQSRPPSLSDFPPKVLVAWLQAC